MLHLLAGLFDGAVLMHRKTLQQSLMILGEDSGRVNDAMSVPFETPGQAKISLP
jgi:hypothetical protein